MPEHHLDHLRARHAQQRVACHFAPWQRQSDSGAREYRGVALGATAYLRQVGLAQLLAFWFSKDRGAEHGVLEDLLRWLTTGPATCAICEAAAHQGQGGGAERPLRELRVGADPKQPREVMGPLLARSARELALLEAEAEAYLLWLRRLAEGSWKALLPDEKRTEGRPRPQPADPAEPAP
jgi:hypothetical protein